MNSERAKFIAEKYISNEVSVLSLAIDILKACSEDYEQGFKDASAEWEASWDRTTTGDPRKK